MADRPVVAVSSCNKLVENEPACAVKNRYLETLARHADVVPLVVPPLGKPDDAAEIVARVDAVMLTGSASNVEPHHYGSAATNRAPHDPARDITTISLIKAARHFGVPIIGVCRGLQEINVAFGGSLSDGRELDEWSHHAGEDVDIEEMFAHTHKVHLAPASLLSRVIGQSEVEVISVHYQHVERLGDGLRVEATADDGVIEAIASREAQPQVLAVQWHPEWRPEQRLHDLRFWHLVGDMARRHKETGHQHAVGI